jgi:hypothetical protein
MTVSELTSSTEDINRGAIFLTHLKPHCENCNAYETPQWRKGWFNETLQHNIELCNACGLKFAKGQYCPYCKFIYGKEHTKSPQDWLSCVQCGRLTHLECELKFGGSSKQNNRLFETEHGTSTYHCLHCRPGSNFAKYDNHFIRGRLPESA